MSIKKSTQLLFDDAQPKKAIFYIDGFNLYYGIKKESKPKLKWLDISKMCEYIVSKENNTIIKSIKYFTAIVKKEDKIIRQLNYIDAIQNKCKYCIKIIKGRFLSHTHSCYSCNRKYKKYEEKQTDVNIACHIMMDMYEGNFDTAIIISADSDLVTPIDIVKTKGKRVVVWAPPNRNSEDLKKISHLYQMIYPATIQKNLLPDEIISNQNHTIIRPKEWS